MSGPRCAVVGTPIRHSLSPVLHRAAYAELGLDWTYEAHELPETALPEFLAGLDDTWRGLSLTMPLKRAVMPLLDSASARARQAGAANTLVLDHGRREGHNTDIPGAVAAVRERYDGPVDRAVILGGGATATSTLLAFADLGCRQITLLVREPARAAAAVDAAGRHPQAPTVEVRSLVGPPLPADVLVSTIPAQAQTEAVLGLAADVPVLFDVIYDPWPTPLARLATSGSTGHTLVAGLDLLVHQAALQVELMTGRGPAPLVAMRAAGEAALRARA